MYYTLHTFPKFFIQPQLKGKSETDYEREDKKKVTKSKRNVFLFTVSGYS